ncbi:MAG TPA: glycan-binding surface protein [Ohtaekwangia sp.]
MKTLQSFRSAFPGLLLMVFAVLLSAGLFVSCSDDEGTPTPPTISSFSPHSGLIGADVVINGTDLNRVTKVEFGSVIATIVSKTKDEIKVEVPPGASTAKIKLKYAEGHILTPEDFTVTFRTIVVSDFEEEDVETVWGKSEDAGDIDVSEFATEGDNSFFKLKGADKNTNHWVGGRYKGTGNPEVPLGVEEKDASKVFFNFDIKSNAAVTPGAEPRFKPVFYVYDATAGSKKKNWECDIKITWTEWKTISISADKFRRYDGGFVDFSGKIETVSEVALYLSGGINSVYDFSIDNIRFSEGAPLGQVVTREP